jgi:hypothetical protein
MRSEGSRRERQREVKRSERQGEGSGRKEE